MKPEEIKSAEEILQKHLECKPGKVIHHSYLPFVYDAMEEYKNQTPVQEAKEETVSKEKVGRLLHAILNYSYEGFKGELGALRDSVVPVYVIETAFKEYFGIVEPEPNF